jgi:hypothetical protein
MPHAACLQDWTHIRGSVNASVVQDAAAWFDLERYCSFWPMIGAIVQVLNQFNWSPL